MSERLEYSYVEKYFAAHGCELLESEYKNARTKMQYRCSCGNISSIVFDSFRRGNRCKKCGSRRAAKKQRLTHEEVSLFFESQGCELLDIYKDSRTPMVYRCVCGNISKINANNFRRGKRCQECLREKRSGPNNYQWIADREAKAEYDRFKQRCYKLVRIAAHAVGTRKTTRTEATLGYTFKEFQQHIQNHPDWSKLKNNRWHVDHIFPIKAFVDYGIKDLKVINSLDNLRPMLYKDNISKGGQYKVSDFENWLESKGIEWEKEN